MEGPSAPHAKSQVWRRQRRRGWRPITHATKWKLRKISSKGLRKRHWLLSEVGHVAEELASFVVDVPVRRDSQAKGKPFAINDSIPTIFPPHPTPSPSLRPDPRVIAQHRESSTIWELH
jgi:hypothetical protein